MRNLQFGSLLTLSRLFALFQLEKNLGRKAGLICSKWVHKPNADSLTLTLPSHIAVSFSLSTLLFHSHSLCLLVVLLSLVSEREKEKEIVNEKLLKITHSPLKGKGVQFSLLCSLVFCLQRREKIVCESFVEEHSTWLQVLAVLFVRSIQFAKLGKFNNFRIVA